VFTNYKKRSKRPSASASLALAAPPYSANYKRSYPQSGLYIFLASQKTPSNNSNSLRQPYLTTNSPVVFKLTATILLQLYISQDDELPMGGHFCSGCVLDFRRCGYHSCHRCLVGYKKVYSRLGWTYRDGSRGTIDTP
jgi:hypothetical protein